MSKHCCFTFGLIAALATALTAQAGETGQITGTVVDNAGNAMQGAIVSVYDAEQQKLTAVLSDEKGQFVLDQIAPATYELRGRRLGFDDTFVDDVTVDASASGKPVKLVLEPTENIHLQRDGASLFSELKWDNEEERMSFKMSCTYCHQVGTFGFRSPEEPVDWEVLITKMDGYGTLVPSLKKDKKIIKKLVDTYADQAVEKWADYTPPEPHSGKSLAVRIVEWDMGTKNPCMIHDLELGKDGLIYTVDMANDAVRTLDPVTGERKTYPVPGGKEPGSSDLISMGPHSIEPDAEGNMWITMAIGGKMGKFDVKTKEWTIVSGAPDPRPRGGYPHTLRVDQKGVVWFTDAALGVLSLDPNNGNKRTFYKLPEEGQAVGRGVGESRGKTPYGISIAPNGDVWYTKLNGKRVGRIKPDVEGGDIKEFEPPFVGPRRLEVAADGMVWVPGCGSGVFAKLNPETEEWTVYDLPNKENQFPYALSVHPQTGDVWICGTCNDSMYRFIPATEELIEYPMPSRVTYTREIEFAEDGSVWVCNSNWPNRHVERRFGSVIRITLDGTVDDQDVKTAKAIIPTKKVISGSGDYVSIYAVQAAVIGRMNIVPDRVCASITGVGTGLLVSPAVCVTPPSPHLRVSTRIRNEHQMLERLRLPALFVLCVYAMTATALVAAEPAGSVVKGRIAFEGVEPEPKVIKMDRDKECVKLHGDKVTHDEDVLIGDAGELKNVFVYIKGGLPRGTKYAMPKAPAVLEQTGCMYRPRVQGVRVNQTLQIVNNDALTHNVRSLPTRNRPFNVGQIGKGTREQVFTNTEREVVEFRCDIHTWMHAFVFVLDHPFFTVTGDDGTFNIKGLPAGEYTLAAWHEVYGEQRSKITVKDDGEQEINFTFKPSDAKKAAGEK